MKPHAPSGPLSLVDTACLHIEGRTTPIVNVGALVFDEPLDFARVKSALEERFLCFPRFRQLVVPSSLPLGAPHWEDDPLFDIRSHLHRLALPARGDDLALQELLSDLISTPLDLTMPPWQAHLIGNYGTGCVMLCRLHHCLADGLALMHVLRSITDRARPRTGPAHAGQEDRRKAPSTLDEAEALLHKGIELLFHPSRLPELAGPASGVAGTLGQLLLREPDTPTAFKGALGVIKQVAWSAPIPEKEVKTVGAVLGASAHEVLLGSVTGALRRYLQQRGQPVSNINLHVAIPVNLRRREEAQALGNRFSMAFLALPLDRDDPLERLPVLRQRLGELKSSLTPEVMSVLMRAYGAAPAPLGEMVLRLFDNKVTAVLSTVPGPPKPRYFAGQAIRRMMFWVPQPGRLGLGLSLLTYAGAVTLGVVADAGLVPDPGAIVRAFQEELEQLRALSLPPGSPVPAAPGPINGRQNRPKEVVS